MDHLGGTLIGWPKVRATLTLSTSYSKNSHAFSPSLSLLPILLFFSSHHPLESFPPLILTILRLGSSLERGSESERTGGEERRGEVGIDR